MVFLQLLPLFCALLFTLTRKISIRVTKRDELAVKINLNIIAILLTEDKIKKNGIKKATRLIRSFKNLIKPTEYLLSKSEIRVYKCTPSSFDNKTFPMLRSLSFLASVQLIYSFLEKNAKLIRFIDHTQADNEADAPFLEFSIHFSPLNLIIFAVIFLYYTVKNKFKRVLKNV